MPFTPTPTGEYASPDRAFVIYPIPEGYVAVQHGAHPTVSPPFSTIDLAATWCNMRASTFTKG